MFMCIANPNKFDKFMFISNIIFSVCVFPYQWYFSKSPSRIENVYIIPMTCGGVNRKSHVNIIRQGLTINQSD